MRILDFSDNFSSSSPPTLTVASFAFTFANNTSTNDVTGALLDATLYGSAQIVVQVRRTTTTKYRYSKVYLECVYDSFNGAWYLVDYVEKGRTNITTPGLPSGITWSLTFAGQLQYATDNMSGSSYTGASRVAMQPVVL